MNETYYAVISLSIDICFISVKLVKVVTDTVHQEELVKACYGGIGLSQKSSILSGQFGRDKTVAMVATRWYF